MSWLFAKPSSFNFLYSLKSDSPDVLRRLSLCLPDNVPWDITVSRANGRIYAVCRAMGRGRCEVFCKWIPREMKKASDFGFESIWKVEKPVDVPHDVGEFISGSATVPLAR